MKKLISILLVIAMMAALAACGNKTNTENPENSDNVVVDVKKDDIDTTEDELDSQNEAEDNKKPAADNKKPATKPDEKPTQKPTENKPAENKPAQKPADEQIHLPNKPAENQPAEKPADKQEEKPSETPKTIGNTLLADFRQKASGMGVLELANALITNSIIQFPGAATLEEGVVSKGFTEEITGFKSAAKFEPYVGSIAFIGYVFELANASEASAFISNLRAKADPSWNICVTADETVTGSVGNKVFFVMSPIEMN